MCSAHPAQRRGPYAAPRLARGAHAAHSPEDGTADASLRRPGPGQIAPRCRRTPLGVGVGAPPVPVAAGRGLPSRGAAAGIPSAPYRSSRAGSPPTPYPEGEAGERGSPRVPRRHPTPRARCPRRGCRCRGGGWGPGSASAILPCLGRASGNFPPGAAAAPSQARHPRGHAQPPRHCPPPGGALRSGVGRCGPGRGGAGRPGLRGRCPRGGGRGAAAR